MRNSKPLSYAHFKDYFQIQYYSLPGLCVAIGPGIKTSFYFSRIVAFTHWKFCARNSVSCCLSVHLILVHFIFLYGPNVVVSSSDYDRRIGSCINDYITLHTGNTFSKNHSLKLYSALINAPVSLCLAQAILMSTVTLYQVSQRSNQSFCAVRM